ncbi:uncharacterized protein IWZ02DRAFT_482394 [Phyllosticta citriasiana]|uniref:uncharacterized protein n=1 Tax=Phyllosticta citriasiana TaxID=595635 RepID=UPI0030FDCF13
MGPINSHYLASPAQNASGSKRIRLFPGYLLNAGGLLILIFLVVAFWSRAASQPFYVSLFFGYWIRQSAKEGAWIWSATASVLAFSTLHMLDKLLHLMVKQKIQANTSLATLEGWSRLSYHKMFLDYRKPWLAAFSLATWVTAHFLVSGYTALLTPKPVLQIIEVTGNDTDVSSDAFRQWATPLWESDKSNLTLCQWWDYTTPDEYPLPHSTIYYPTCSWAKDSISFTSSGMVSALESSLLRGLDGTFKTYTRVADSIFDGSTGGVLPIGDVGIAAFAYDLEYKDVPDYLNYTASWNYTLIQQGFSVDIVCTNTTDSTPISRSEPDPVNVTNGYVGQDMTMYTFTYDTSDCTNPLHNDDTYVTPVDSSLGVYVCMGDDVEANKWTMYLRAFDEYERTFGNMTCTIDPYLTKNEVTYEGNGFMIYQNKIGPVGDGSFVPPDLMMAIWQALTSSYSSTSNNFLDAVIAVSGTAATFKADASNATLLLQDALRGVFEYQGTMARIHYRAQNSPGLAKSIKGNFTIERMGWSGSPTSIASLLPLLTFVLGSAIWYCLEGMRAENRHATTWDPLNPVCLMAAGAAGGSAGRLGVFQGKGGADEKDRTIKKIKVRFVGEQGLIADWGHGGESGGVSYQAVVAEKDQLMGRERGM